jgi:hypothetical protein
MLRNYTDADYEKLKQLYMHSEWFGGHFNENRDSQQRLAKLIVRDPESIIVYEKDDEITGTVSLFEDGRGAWLFRFVVKDNDPAITRELYQRAVELMKVRGHDEVLVYAPVGDETFRQRYMDVLGMQKGDDYTCYWANI